MVEVQEKDNYDPAIDALRGVAVLLVILGHLAYLLPIEYQTLFFAGGFIGVDVFFCSSGYLITKINLEKCDRHAYRPSHFVVGRIMRLFPAAISVAVAVMCTSLLFMQLQWMSKSEVYDAAWAGLSQMTFWSNFYFGSTIDYFAPEATSQPFLHTWSLCLEEQFYFVFALILLPLARFNRKVFCGVLLLLAISSFLFNLSSFPSQNQMAYYSPLSRIWQILIGCLIAVLPPPKLTIGFGKALGILAIVALPIAACGINEQMWYPHVIALVPVLITVAAIWANRESQIVTQFLAFRCSSARPLVWIGMISYSLYLWHWPVIVFAKMTGFRGVFAMIGCSAFSFLLAAASYYWIEFPIRKTGKKLLALRRQEKTSGQAIEDEQANSKRHLSYWLLGISGGAGVVMGLGFACLTLVSDFVIKTRQDRYPAYITEIEDIQNDRFVAYEPHANKQGGIAVIGKADGPAKLLLWGDSYAMHTIPAAHQWLLDQGYKGYVITYPGIQPVVGPGSAEDREWVQTTLEFIQRHHIPNVLQVSYWSAGSSPRVPATVRTINEKGAQVFVMLNVPEFDKTAWRDYDLGNEDALTTPVSKADTRQEPPLQMEGAVVINPRSQFLSADGQFYTAIHNGKLMYCDAAHLSRDGSIRLLLPTLKQIQLR